MLLREHGCIAFNILDNREIPKDGDFAFPVQECLPHIFSKVFQESKSGKTRMTEKSGVGIREFCQKDLTNIKTASSQDKEM